MKRLLVYIICFIMIQSCQFLFQLKSDEILKEKIENEISSENKIDSLSNLTNFDWDSLIVIGPYSSIVSIEDEFKLDLSNIRQNPIDYSDGYNLVVFLNDNKSVKIVETQLTLSPTRKVVKSENLKFKMNKDGIITLIEN